MTIQPTVGRIVHFVLDDGPNKGAIRPAIITRVWGDACVQLSVFPEVNDQLPPVCMRSSALLVKDGVNPLPGMWMWMPYQIGQAAKTEAAEAKLADLTSTKKD